MHKILPLALMLASALALAEPATVARPADLKAKPFIDAATVTQLAKDARVDVQSRDGAWAQVKTGSGQSGWLKALNLRTGESSSGNGAAGIGQLANVARTGSSGNTTATAAKGVSAEKLKNATPNYKEVDQMKRYAVSRSDAQQFATMTKLKPRVVAAIEVPTSSNQQNRKTN